jgi:hypothetical protein
MHRLWGVANRHKDKAAMMSDPIDEFFEELEDILSGGYDATFRRSLRDIVEQILADNDLMLAPISDPTNLFGVMEDIDA